VSFRISSAVASLTAQRYLHKNQRQVEKSLSALASGKRLVKAGDGAASFAIGEGLRGQVSGLHQSQLNAKNAVALVQAVEGGLNEQNNILIRLRELSVSSISDTVGKQEREFLDKEFQSLVLEFDRIAKSVRFGNKQLLTGSGKEFKFHVGPFKGPENVINFKLNSDTTADSVGIEGTDISSQDDALDALESLDQALSDIARARSTFGAAQSRLQFTIDVLAAQEENIEKARSLVMDVDVAEEVSRLAKAQILQDMGVAVLAQANQHPLQVARLIPG